METVQEVNSISDCTPEVVIDRARMEELLEIWENGCEVNVLALPDMNTVCVQWQEQAAVFQCQS